MRFYRDLLGMPLRRDLDHGGTDRWISGDHAALSWHDSFFHFALYKSKGAVTRDVQLGFPVGDLDAMHKTLVAAGVPVDVEPRDEALGPHRPLPRSRRQLGVVDRSDAASFSAS